MLCPTINEDTVLGPERPSEAQQGPARVGSDAATSHCTPGSRTFLGRIWWLVKKYMHQMSVQVRHAAPGRLHADWRILTRSCGPWGAETPENQMRALPELLGGSCLQHCLAESQLRTGPEMRTPRQREDQWPGIR